MSEAEGAASWTNRVKNGEILYRVTGKKEHAICNATKED